MWSCLQVISRMSFASEIRGSWSGKTLGMCVIRLGFWWKVACKSTITYGLLTAKHCMLTDLRTGITIGRLLFEIMKPGDSWQMNVTPFSPQEQGHWCCNWYISVFSFFFFFFKLQRILAWFSYYFTDFLSITHGFG